MIVVDSSIALAHVLQDESSEMADDVVAYLQDEATDALVPVHFTVEYVNGLLMAKRRKRLDEALMSPLIAKWLDAPLEIDMAAEIEEVVDLADMYNLTIYDALYLELAIRRKVKLATLDKALAAAAKKEKVVFKR